VARRQDIPQDDVLGARTSLESHPERDNIERLGNAGIDTDAQSFGRGQKMSRRRTRIDTGPFENVPGICFEISARSIHNLEADVSLCHARSKRHKEGLQSS
jgi:hypothetical protein